MMLLILQDSWLDLKDVTTMEELTWSCILQTLYWHDVSMQAILKPSTWALELAAMHEVISQRLTKLVGEVRAVHDGDDILRGVAEAKPDAASVQAPQQAC